MLGYVILFSIFQLNSCLVQMGVYMLHFSENQRTRNCHKCRNTKVKCFYKTIVIYWAALEEILFFFSRHGTAAQHSTITFVAYNSGVFQSHLVSLIGDKVCTKLTSFQWRILPVDGLRIVASDFRLLLVSHCALESP